MKKLTLDLDQLQVDTFDTYPERNAGQGTVRGMGPSESCLTDICGYGCTGNWCQGETTAPCQAGTYAGATCDTTCGQIICGCTDLEGTCDASCNGSCPAHACG